MNLKKLLAKRYTTEDVECLYAHCIGHLCTVLSEMQFARNTLPLAGKWRNEKLCAALNEAIEALLKRQHQDGVRID